MRGRGALALAMFGLVFATGGCRTLDRFDTGGHKAYCGNIVSSAFVRQGFAPDLRLLVRIDTDNLQTVPGSLSSNDSGADPDAGAAAGPCAPQPLFAESPMTVTEELFSDPLSAIEFGTGRDHNFFAWTESACKGSMLTVVSLMKNDDVEVRLMKPPDPPVVGSTEQPKPWFGLFQLTRQKDDCL